MPTLNYTCLQTYCCTTHYPYLLHNQAYIQLHSAFYSVRKLFKVLLSEKQVPSMLAKACFLDPRLIIINHACKSSAMVMYKFQFPEYNPLWFRLIHDIPEAKIVFPRKTSILVQSCRSNNIQLITLWVHRLIVITDTNQSWNAKVD